jgi:hypothetical protein
MPPMSARKLRSDRAQAGAAVGINTNNVSNPGLIGGTGADPFIGDEYSFPSDLTMNNNWIEFVAKPTKGLLESDVLSALGITGFGSAVAGEGGVVRLPLPANLSTDYNPSYSTPDLGMAAGSVLKPFDRAIYGNNDIPGQAAAGGAAAGVGLAALGALGLGTAVGQTASAGLNKLGVTGDALGAALKVGGGIAQNPHKIVLFTGVDFRDHSFSWKLSPRNRRESDIIRRIIAMFTYYSHPSFEAGGLFFKYPEFFEIKFAKDSYLFKMRPSVCTDIKVDYHAQGYAAYIRNADGTGEPAPAEVSLSLTFKETEIISKQFLNPGTPVSAIAPTQITPQALEGRTITPPNLSGQIQPNMNDPTAPVTVIPGGGRYALPGSGPAPEGGGNFTPPAGALRTPSRR